MLFEFIFCFDYWYFLISWNQIGVWYWKCIPLLVLGFSIPVDHCCQDYAVVCLVKLLCLPDLLYVHECYMAKWFHSNSCVNGQFCLSLLPHSVHTLSIYLCIIALPTHGHAAAVIQWQLALITYYDLAVVHVTKLRHVLYTLFSGN